MMTRFINWLNGQRALRKQKRVVREVQEVRDDAVRRLTIREASMELNGEYVDGVAICLDGIVVGFIKDGEGDATKKLLELREYYLKTLGPNQQIRLK